MHMAASHNTSKDQKAMCAAEGARDWVWMKMRLYQLEKGPRPPHRCFLLFRNNIRCHFLAELSKEGGMATSEVRGKVELESVSILNS